MVPDFEMLTADGRKMRMSDLRGKVVVIDLFATWCKPCKEEMPEMQRALASQYGKDKLEILAVGYGHDARALKQFERRYPYNFTYIQDPEKRIFNYFAEYMLPRKIVVDPQGKIIFQCVGYFPQVLVNLIYLAKKEAEQLN